MCIPQPTSLSRAVGFNCPKIDAFYHVYKTTLETHKFGPNSTWNMDESGITNVQKTVRIVATKRQRQIGKMTSGEWGSTVTIICAVSAAGSYILPMLLFPRKRTDWCCWWTAVGRTAHCL